MTGLRSRLESISGVESIELELGENGLTGITLRLAEGADEATVLDGVRRLLVTYGTKAPRSMAAASVGGGGMPAKGSHEIIDLDAAATDMMEPPPPVTMMSSGESEATMTTPEGESVELSVRPGGVNTIAQVVYSRGNRVARRQVPSTPRAIVQAVIDVAAEIAGSEPVSVVGMNLSDIGGTRVLTVIAGNHGASPKVSTVSVIDRNWPAALLAIVADIFD